MSYRISKINELIRHQMAEILTRELSLKPGVFVTVTKVDTSRDLRYTRLFVSIFPEKEINYVLETLKKETYNLQGKLNKKLFLKTIPKLEFLTDETEINADKVEKLLKSIEEE